MWKRYSSKSKPRPGQMILVIGRDASKVPEPNAYFKRFQSIAQYKGNGKLILKEPVYPYYTQITHWKPLPPFPEDSKWYRFLHWCRNFLKVKS